MTRFGGARAEKDDLYVASYWYPHDNGIEDHWVVTEGRRRDVRRVLKELKEEDEHLFGHTIVSRHHCPYWASPMEVGLAESEDPVPAEEFVESA